MGLLQDLDLFLIGIGARQRALVWDHLARPRCSQAVFEPLQELGTRHGVQFDAFAFPGLMGTEAFMDEKGTFVLSRAASAETHGVLLFAVGELLALQAHRLRCHQAQPEVNHIRTLDVLVAACVGTELIENLQPRFVKVMGHKNRHPCLGERFDQRPRCRHRHAFGAHEGHIKAAVACVGLQQRIEAFFLDKEGMRVAVVGPRCCDIVPQEAIHVVKDEIPLPGRQLPTHFQRPDAKQSAGMGFMEMPSRIEHNIPMSREVRMRGHKVGQELLREVGRRPCPGLRLPGQLDNPRARRIHDLPRVAGSRPRSLAFR